LETLTSVPDFYNLKEDYTAYKTNYLVSWEMKKDRIHERESLNNAAKWGVGNIAHSFRADKVDNINSIYKNHDCPSTSINGMDLLEDRSLNQIAFKAVNCLIAQDENMENTGGYINVDYTIANKYLTKIKPLISKCVRIQEACLVEGSDTFEYPCYKSETDCNQCLMMTLKNDTAVALDKTMKKI